MMSDAESSLRGHAAHEGAGVGLSERSVHVHDAPALKTREVVVLAGVAVEAGMRSGYLLDQSLLDEPPQIAIHGAQADPREAAADHPMHGLGRGMRRRAADDLQDDPARLGASQAHRAEGRIGRGIGSRAAHLFSNDCHYDL